MQPFAEYKQSKQFFLSKQYSESASIIQNKQNCFHGDGSFIMNANLFISKIICDFSLFNEEYAYNVADKLGRILSTHLKNQSLSSFWRNISLLAYKNDKLDLSYKYIELAIKYDESKASVKLFQSYGICLLDSNDVKMSFTSLWCNYLLKNNQYILSNARKYEQHQFCNFLLAEAYIACMDYKKSLECYLKSIEKGFRLTESYNGAGICFYHLGRKGESLKAFENAIRTKTKESLLSLYNASEVCGSIGNMEKRLTLLNYYNDINTYETNSEAKQKQAELYMHFQDFDKASNILQELIEESKKSGVTKSSHMIDSLYAYTLNMTGCHDQAILINNQSDSFSLLVRAHSLFLSSKYRECYKLLENKSTFDTLINSAIIEFIGGDQIESFKTLEKAKKLNPKSNIVTRVSTLIRLSNQSTIKSGYYTWLSLMGYQISFKSISYESAIDMLPEDRKKDKITLSAIKFILNNTK